MGTPMEWLERSRQLGLGGGGIQSYTPPAPGYASPPQGAPDFEEDPRDDAARARRRREAEEELDDEAEAARHEREMRRTLRMATMERQIAELRNPGGGQQPAVAQLMAQMAEDRRVMMETLTAAQQQAAQSQQQALQTQLATLEQRLAAIPTNGNGNGAPGSEISRLIEGLREMATVRTALDSFAPPPAPNPALNPAQMAEQQRWQAEAAIRQTELDLRLQEIRQQAARDQQASQIGQHRFERAIGGVEQLAGTLLPALLGDRAAQAAGNGNGNGNGAGMTATVSGPPQMVPWRCAECNVLNHVPAGTTFAVCSSCHASAGLYDPNNPPQPPPPPALPPPSGPDGVPPMAAEPPSPMGPYTPAVLPPQPPGPAISPAPYVPPGSGSIG